MRHLSVSLVPNLRKTMLSPPKLFNPWILTLGQPLRNAKPNVLHTLRKCYFGLKTRIIIKISTHPCYPINFEWFSWEWSKKQNVRLKKTEIFNSLNSQLFFPQKFKGLLLGLVHMINWCKRHWYATRCIKSFLEFPNGQTQSKMTQNSAFCFFLQLKHP